MDKIFKEELIQKLGKDIVRVDEPMSKHTTFKIGGPADVFILPKNSRQLQDALSIINRYKIPYYVMGRGSNLLVGDKGFRGAVLCIYGNMKEIDVTEDEDQKVKVTAGAGIMLSELSEFLAEKGYAGFEFAAGIPGTLGGAVTMNAGAYGGEIKDCIVAAKVMDLKGHIRTLYGDELELGYRSSIIQKEHLIVLDATFSFIKEAPSLIWERVHDFNGRRRDKQPLEMPSAGSTFKRPEGYFAGKLIMDSGLAGFRIGDAGISEKHCGFVVNNGHATAKDTLALIREVDRIVFEKYGVHLEPEVRIIGEF